MHTHRPDVLHAPGPLVRRFLRVQAISPALVFRALISVAAIHAIAALTTDRCLADEEATVERGDRRYFELATPEAKDLSPLLLRILSPPVPFPKSDGKSHLLTELLLTNSDKASLQIQRVEVLDGEAMKVLRSFTGEEVAANMTLLNNPADTDILPAGQTGLVYLDVAVDPPHVPRTVVHKILERNGTRTITVTGAKIAVDTMTNLPVFGSPFTGGTWVASDAASPRSHHRRGPFNLNGELYLSQRYAIDCAPGNVCAR